MAKPPEHILVSRTDSIGDVMLTLPMLGLLKRTYPNTRIGFLGRDYTLPILSRCAHVDGVHSFDRLHTGSSDAATEYLRSLGAAAIIHAFPQHDVANWAKRAGIPLRIGTSHRWWHWLTCNERPSFSRRNSDLHEAQLNMKLLEPMGISSIPGTSEIPSLYGFSALMPDALTSSLIDTGRKNMILHPGSQGSAAEWGLENFSKLMGALDPARFRCIVTGTEKEAQVWRHALPLEMPHVVDAGGSLSLDQMIALIGASDALVAASTGPLHIAAALGKRAVGLFSPRRPIHPGRWAPLGTDAHALVFDPACPRCANVEACDCITRIPPQRVIQLLEA